MDRPRPQPRGWYVSRATCPRNLTEASGRLVSAALWRVRLASGPHRAALFLWVAHEYRMHWLDRLHIPRQCLTTPRKPAVLVFVNSAQAQSYNNGGPCGPERTIDALANAVIRAPIFRKPRAAPVETTGVAPASPPAPQPSMTREQWKQSLIEPGGSFASSPPTDSRRDTPNRAAVPEKSYWPGCLAGS